MADGLDGGEEATSEVIATVQARSEDPRQGRLSEKRQQREGVQHRYREPSGYQSEFREVRHQEQPQVTGLGYWVSGT